MGQDGSINDMPIRLTIFQKPHRKAMAIITQNRVLRTIAPESKVAIL